MKKLKIAVLIDWYLPGTKAGGPVRSVYSILNLLNNDYEFYLITRNTDLGSAAPYPSVTPDILFEKDNVFYYYFSAAHLTAQNLEDLLSKVNPDLIYSNSFWSFPFSIQVVRAYKNRKLSAPVLIAPRGMLGKGALGLKSLKKKTYIAAAKLFEWYKNVAFHATQQQEEQDILKVFPGAKIFKAPNINATKAAKNVSIKTGGHLKLFFLSRISVVKNLHFALEVLEQLPPHLSVTYDIYGNNEDKLYWEKCAATIERLPPNVRVTLKGELAFDRIPETISHYNILFLPTLNENYGHSIVESLLCGCPVIISDQTPWNDVEEFNAGYALPLTGQAAFLKVLILMAGEDQRQFNSRSEAANNYISTKIDLPRIVQQYKQLFDGCSRH